MLNFPKYRYQNVTVNWLSGDVFWDQFLAALDVKTNMADVVKVSHLKGILSKDVQEPIRDLIMTNENYSIAFKILRECYANKQVLISAYMKCFVKLQPLTSTKNVSGLRAIYDSVERNYIIYQI